MSTVEETLQCNGESSKMTDKNSTLLLDSKGKEHPLKHKLMNCDKVDSNKVKEYSHFDGAVKLSESKADLSSFKKNSSTIKNNIEPAGTDFSRPGYENINC